MVSRVTNPDDGEIQIKAVAQLQSITDQLNQYYIQLPTVARVGVIPSRESIFSEKETFHRDKAKEVVVNAELKQLGSVHRTFDNFT